MGRLFLVATPIGNLEDITARALRTLREAVLIAAEDTRHTGKLLSAYEIRTPVISYHEHNKLVRLNRLMEALESGDVALVSDAGTPGLNDPGFELVRRALASGHEVVPVPGPSAPIAALVASGLPTDSFVFLGYLPRRAGQRRTFLESLKGESRTLVALEAPHRLVDSLEDILGMLGDRPLVVAREMTKVHEEFVRGSVRDAIRRFRDGAAPLGECTLVIGGALEAPAWNEEEIRRALQEKIDQGASASRAAGEVASLSGVSRKDLYRIIHEK